MSMVVLELLALFSGFATGFLKHEKNVFCNSIFHNYNTKILSFSLSGLRSKQ